MARSKEFDQARALAAAVDVFWRQGYENTSLEALMREMGIARQSLYDTFGDKRALYLKAMAFYRERTNSSLRESLASAATVKEGAAEAAPVYVVAGASVPKTVSRTASPAGTVAV